MRVLITGAGGSLGTALPARLEAAGHEPILSDIASLETGYEFVRADVRRLEQVRAAMKRIDVVVHAAAIHGIHLRDHSAQEFYELNLTGTFNVWEAAVEAGVRGFVFSSTMGVYGQSREPAADDRAVALHEDLPLQPTDIYGYTKLAGEELCRFYVRRHGIPAVALRYGMFVPEPFFRYGIRLLYGGVDVVDVAEAVVVAVEALVERRVEWDAFNVHSLVPFREQDAADLRNDPLPVLDRYFPGTGDLLRERGVKSLQPIDSYFPMAAIEQRLGFRPHHNFGEWLDKLRQRPDERAEKPVPWP